VHRLLSACSEKGAWQLPKTFHRKFAAAYFYQRTDNGPNHIAQEAVCLNGKYPFRETEWVFTIQADRFLRNMVRAIVGTLVEVGRGKLSVEGFRKVIEEKNRCSAGTSVPGHALFLVDIGYPDELFPLG
jgi:tRNA pseudouridine(38-40) synthase